MKLKIHQNVSSIQNQGGDLKKAKQRKSEKYEKKMTQ